MRASVARAVTDTLCLDDQRLRLVSGSQGVAGFGLSHRSGDLRHCTSLPSY
jgi:hypothetical protein